MAVCDWIAGEFSAAPTFIFKSQKITEGFYRYGMSCLCDFEKPDTGTSHRLPSWRWLWPACSQPQMTSWCKKKSYTSFIYFSWRQQVRQVYIPCERNQLYKIFRKFYPIRKLLLVGMDYFLSLYGIYLWNISIYHL